MDLVIQDSGRVRHMVLNRPAKRNALNRQMCADIVAAVKAADEQAEIGCTLLTAEGGAFCAGMDLAENTDRDELLRIHEQLFTLGAEALKPIVMGVQGVALAGGLGLVAQGHVVVAAQDATFALTEIKVGLWPFVVYRSVEAALGARRVLHLSLTGRAFDAAEAQAWGLVQEVCSAQDLATRARNLADALAVASPAAIAEGMGYVRQARGKAWQDAGLIAAARRAKLMASGDFKEGVAAFKEKRAPRWPSLRS